MKEDLFVSSGNGTGVRYDDECSLDGSDENSVNTTDESDGSDENDGSDESDEEKLVKPYAASKKKATGKPTAGKGKSEIPKRHRSQRYWGTRGSGGDSATSISPGSFRYHDCDQSSDPASVANNHSPERPSKLHFDSWMPSRDASLISRRRSSEIEKKLMGDKGRELRRRDGNCLREIKLRSFHVQHIVVGSRGSVRVLARLDKEREMSVWTRTALVEAWGRERADQLLSFYLRFYIKRARARRLPNNKRRKIQQGGNGSMFNWDKEFEELKVRVEGGKQ
ncbi:hypothetical protein NOF04DRAFT_1255213 [Fusarium oxysporum II5]|nr:hypothetical protein NOF04DRAFT_1255213 [Fusarium oxysporum II5]